MIRVLHSLLVDILPAEQTLPFYPYLHFQPIDEWDHKNRLRSSTFPATDTSHLSRWVRSQVSSDSSANASFGWPREDTPRLTVQAGDFLSVYSPFPRDPAQATKSEESAEKILRAYRESSFDGIVTSFFLDTGNDLLDYLLTLQHLLRPGGIWVNTGPLHYHSVTATPYSYRLVREIIQGLGFIALESTIIESSYCGEEAVVMKPEHYRYPLEIWRLEKQPAMQERQAHETKVKEAVAGTNFVVNLLGRK
jgi:hypothetical protein